MSDDVIPEDGRDVQCSNCGQTWFVEKYPDQQDADGSLDPVDTPLPATAPRPRPAPRSYPPAEEKIAQAATRKPRRAPVADDVQAVLQEEAARELAARQADANADLEVQDEFALDPPEQAPMEEIASTSRRSQLPDIEEINSSLAATTSQAIPAAEPTPEEAGHKKTRRKRGFRFGFVFALLVLAILAAMYIFAPNITEAMPQYADQVNSYVFLVNDVRQWMFEMAEVLVAKIQELAGTAPPPAE